MYFNELYGQGHHLEDRPASDVEKELLRHLVSTIGDETRRQTLLAQVDTLRVVARCRCGCPSVDFVHDEDDHANIIVDVEGESPEGVLVGVMLRARGDVLTSLEVYAMDGTEKFSLPRPSDLDDPYSAA